VPPNNPTRLPEEHIIIIIQTQPNKRSLIISPNFHEILEISSTKEAVDKGWLNDNFPPHLPEQSPIKELNESSPEGGVNR